MRRSLPALALAAAIALTSCGGGDDDTAAPTPAPSASVSAPAPSASSPPVVTPPAPASTAPPSTSSLPRATPGKLSAWRACGGSFRCATLTVALDDKDAGKGTVGLALIKRPATGSKIGSLVVNPGGPGGSAVDYLRNAYSGLPSVVRARFDLVAFDPRGVGQTAPVRCGTTAELDRYFHLDPVPDSAAELTALTEGNTAFQKGCVRRSGRVLPYVSTTIVAQDLDRVRQAVGDAKLTYLGYSYGTSIGAAYLKQYPRNVRAMVLDGALDPTLTWDGLLAGQSRGFDVALSAFLADCEKTSCAFRKAVKGSLTAAFDQLAANVETKALPGDGTRVVGPSEFTLGVGAGLYSRRFGWPAIAAALAGAVDGQGDALLALSDSYLERSDTGYANISEANFAVNCIDRPWPDTVAPYQALADRVAKAYPRFGPAIALSGLGCIDWPVDAVSTPGPVSGAGSPPIVVVGTTRDPATPYAWSQALAKQLAKGVLITYRGDGHTVYRSTAPACVEDPVNAYLVSGTAPAATTC